jgi:hypothetical protein
MDNPQKRYDAWAKWKTDPSALARDALDQLDDTTAYIDYIEIMGGKKVPGREDASKEHIMIHRKQMITDAFRNAKQKIQKNFLAHVAEEVNSLQMRTDLDMLAAQGADLLAPGQPQPNPPSPGGMPGQPPGVLPPPPGGMPPAGGPPGMGAMPQGLPQTPPNIGQIMGGGLPQPGGAQLPPVV